MDIYDKLAKHLDDLPAGSTLGTSSPRRAAQLVRARRDIRAVPLSGNLDTRLRKLEEGQVDGIVVALSGLLRMGWETVATEVIDPRVMMPAGGQGALAVEARSSDEDVLSMLQSIDHPQSRLTVEAERAALSRLAVGCGLPVGVMAVADDDRLVVQGRLLSPDGRKEASSTASGRQREAQRLGKRLARQLLRKGGKEIIAAWRDEP